MARKLLTSQEMAEHLRVSVQVFRRDVKEKGIPHLLSGKRKRFDPEKVEAYLVAKAEPVSNVIRLKIDKQKKRVFTPSRFSNALDVSCLPR